MHISSLPSDCGIGTLGRAAFRFVDFLHEAGQKNWQVLPIGPTSYGDSPYQSFSSFAGNPYFIDLDILAEEGLLSGYDYKGIDWGDSHTRVDYYKIYINRFNVLRAAFENSKSFDCSDINRFAEVNSRWLPNYALYMAVKRHFDQREWLKWDDDIKMRSPHALEHYQKIYEDEINFWVFVQYHFYKQWFRVKEYANSRGIKIIGDVPIYVAMDSADTWANSEVFLLNDNRVPISVAGCPPDAFSATGQLWGNPIYNWDYLRQTEYSWWKDRISSLTKLFDVVRIDHFRGFDSYYTIPYGNATAEHGCWHQGPGIDFFNRVRHSFGKMEVIAEDLGYITDSVRQMLKETGFPGMKVLQFAFDSREVSDYLPFNYPRNCVVYTGTHDNDTVMGWFNTAPKEDVKYSMDFFDMDSYDSWKFIRGAWASVADLAIAPLQDFLSLGSEARMNTPSTLGGSNWCFRIEKHMLTHQLAQEIKNITVLYGR